MRGLDLFDGIKHLTSAGEPTFAKARAFAEHCFGLMSADGLVPAARLELAGMVKLAPYLIILGVIDDGMDFQVRLTGTKLVDEFFGVDPTGSKLSQLLTDDEFGRRGWQIVKEVQRTKRPVLNQPGRARLRSKDYMRLETVTFPLVDDGGSVAKIATLYDYLFEKPSFEVSR